MCICYACLLKMPPCAIETSNHGYSFGSLWHLLLLQLDVLDMSSLHPSAQFMNKEDEEKGKGRGSLRRWGGMVYI